MIRIDCKVNITLDENNLQSHLHNEVCPTVLSTFKAKFDTLFNI